MRRLAWVCCCNDDGTSSIPRSQRNIPIRCSKAQVRCHLPVINSRVQLVKTIKVWIYPSHSHINALCTVPAPEDFIRTKLEISNSIVKLGSRAADWPCSIEYFIMRNDKIISQDGTKRKYCTLMGWLTVHLVGTCFVKLGDGRSWMKWCETRVQLLRGQHIFIRREKATSDKLSDRRRSNGNWERRVNRRGYLVF